jgi:predicted glycosyltransferase involved in capsule biosynthesis
MDNLSIILPYRPDHSYHDINFKYVHRKLKEEYPNSEIIIGEDTHGKELFNRSAAINNGVEKSNNDILMISDVDILLPRENVEASIESLKTYPSIFPYDKFWLLPKDLSQKIVNGMEYTWESLFNYDVQQLIKEGKIGAAVELVTRNAFDSVGRFDERFTGWGTEDVWFNFRMKEKYPLPDGAWGKWLPNSNLFHLWHEQPVPNEENNRLYEILVKEHQRTKL